MLLWIVGQYNECNVTLRFVLADMIQNGLRFIPRTQAQLGPLQMEEEQQKLPVPSAAGDKNRENATLAFQPFISITNEDTN